MIRCIGFKPLARGSMLGFADLEMSSGLILRGCTYHESYGKHWCSPPGRPQLDADRKLMVDEGGKIVYAAVVDFASKDVRTRWSTEAVAAIDEYLISTPTAAA
jgi:hypothetical protein